MSQIFCPCQELDPAHPEGSVTFLNSFGLILKLFRCNFFSVSQQGTFTPVETVFKLQINWAAVHLMVID
jgi:hypothetical protein